MNGHRPTMAAPSRLPLWVLNAPIAGWWVGMALLTIIGSPLAFAWFASGLLMLVNCVLCDEVDRAEDAAADTRTTS